MRTVLGRKVVLVLLLLASTALAQRPNHGVPVARNLGPLSKSIDGPHRALLGYAGYGYYVDEGKVYGVAGLMSLAGKGGPIEKDIRRSIKTGGWVFIKRIPFVPPRGNTPEFLVYERNAKDGPERVSFGTPTGSQFFNATFDYLLNKTEAARFKRKYGDRYGIRHPLGFTIK